MDSENVMGDGSTKDSAFAAGHSEHHLELRLDNAAAGFSSDPPEENVTFAYVDDEIPCTSSSLLYSASSRSPPTPVTPGMKDSDGFLTPPPASTLLLRRTRTNSTGSSTFVVPSPTVISSSSANTSSEFVIPPSLPLDIQKPFSVPYRRIHKRTSDRRTEPSYKRFNYDNNKVNVLLTPQGSSTSHVKFNVTNTGLHHRSTFPPISPLAIDPTHALSVTLSADRSISTVVPIDSLPQPSTSMSTSLLTPFSYPAAASLPYTATSASELESTSSGFESMIPTGTVLDSNGKPKSRGGKSSAAYLPGPQPIASTSSSIEFGEGTGIIEKRRRRGERGPDRFPNIDPNTGRRRYIRKRRFTIENLKRQSSRARLQNRIMAEGYDADVAGKWRPTDDLRLIINVLQTNDLETVHIGVRFSCRFSLESIEQRWVGLLYDKAISKVSQNAIRNLHHKIIAEIHENALFSADEDRILKTVRSNHDAKSVVPVIDKLLKEHSLVFIKWRTTKVLVEHWLRLKEFHLLSDQNVANYFDQQSFSDFEDNLADTEVRENYDIDPNIRREILIENRHTRKRIRSLEEEISRWQLLADLVTRMEPFEEGSYAMLRGKEVRYLMRSREITLGRRTPTSMNIDADLTLEGSVYKVSRKQATIQLREMGDFAIFNHGKHAIYVDGSVIMSGQLGPLCDQSVVEISQLRFVFLINHKLVGEQRRKLVRLEVKKEMARLAKIARFIKAQPDQPITDEAIPFNLPKV